VPGRGTSLTLDLIRAWSIRTSGAFLVRPDRPPILAPKLDVHVVGSIDPDLGCFWNGPLLAARGRPLPGGPIPFRYQ
jgi:hypothetical protein